MSDFPSFLQTTKPATAIVTYGDELSATEINLLRARVRSLHYHPIIVVLPKHHHVKDGYATVSEIAKTWGLHPHGMLIVYSPADKDVWAQCGTFNTSAGVDAGFFKRDFAQRMPTDTREGGLFSALNASLLDVDRIIVRSQAYARVAANNQISQHPGQLHRNPGHTSIVLQQMPVVVLLVMLLLIMARVSGQARVRRMRLDERGHAIPNSSSATGHGLSEASTPGLSSDVDRLLRVIEHGSGAPVRPKSTQVPMAEFHKRASIPVSRSTGSSRTVDGGRFGEERPSTGVAAGSGAVAGVYNSTGARRGEVDHAADFQTAIDSSAAKARQEARKISAEKASETTRVDFTNGSNNDSNRYSNSDSSSHSSSDSSNTPVATPADRTYMASFESSSSNRSPAAVSSGTNLALNLSNSSNSSSCSEEPKGDQSYNTLPQYGSSQAGAADGDVLFAGLADEAPASNPGILVFEANPNSSPVLVVPDSAFGAAAAAGFGSGAGSGFANASLAAVPASKPPESSPLAKPVSVEVPTQFHSVSFPASAAIAVAAALGTGSTGSTGAPVSSSFSNSPASAGVSASDAFNSSFGQSIDLTFNLGSTGGVVSSLTSSGATSQVDLACPKCTEPKSKDFSFCLKCGHNF